jgi:hypothetical protein
MVQSKVRYREEASAIHRPGVGSASGSGVLGGGDCESGVLGTAAAPAAPLANVRRDEVQRILQLALIYAVFGVLGTWLLNLFFRKWFDLVLWPRLADWWASRSRSKTEQRIRKLEGALSRIESLPILSDYEDMVLRGLFGVLILLTILPPLGQVAYLMAFAGPMSLLGPQTFAEFVFGLWTFLFIAMGIGMGQTIVKFRQERSSAYRATLRENIDKLKAGLI